MFVTYSASVPLFLPPSLSPFSPPISSLFSPAVVPPRARITVQPAPQLLIIPGQPARFTVTAVGDNLMYQWQKDGVNISGATLANFNISSVTESDEGMYHCIAHNACDMDVSDAAQLTVCKCT